jgi:hypothetical protein
MVEEEELFDDVTSSAAALEGCIRERFTHDAAECMSLSEESTAAVEAGAALFRFNLERSKRSFNVGIFLF